MSNAEKRTSTTTDSPPAQPLDILSVLAAVIATANATPLPAPADVRAMSNRNIVVSLASIADLRTWAEHLDTERVNLQPYRYDDTSAWKTLATAYRDGWVTGWSLHLDATGPADRAAEGGAR